MQRSFISCRNISQCGTSSSETPPNADVVVCGAIHSFAVLEAGSVCHSMCRLMSQLKGDIGRSDWARVVFGLTTDVSKC